MIKFIATDMDFTLLKDDRSVPSEIWDIIDSLYKQDVLFMIASARGYFNLSKIFASVKDKIGFICDNGAYVNVKGKEFLSNPLSKDVIKGLVDTCDSISGISCLLCGKNALYYTDKQNLDMGEAFVRDFNAQYVKNLSDVSEEVYRFGIDDPQNPIFHSIPIIQEKYGDKLNIIATDTRSVDIMEKGINKGTAVKAILKKLGIKKEEAMIFGDYYNDVAMFKEVEYSFAMENAPEDVKKMAHYIAPSNEDLGVIKTIEKYVLK